MRYRAIFSIRRDRRPRSKRCCPMAACVSSRNRTYRRSTRHVRFSPAHRKIFRIFQDCEKMLDPDISDLFEREANNFARFVLFQGDGYRDMAADHKFEIKTPMKLASKFGASVYASCREFARTHHRACAVYVLEPVIYCERTGARADVRRIETS